MAAHRAVTAHRYPPALPDGMLRTRRKVLTLLGRAYHHTSVQHGLCSPITAHGYQIVP